MSRNFQQACKYTNIACADMNIIYTNQYIFSLLLGICNHKTKKLNCFNQYQTVVNNTRTSLQLIQLNHMCLYDTLVAVEVSSMQCVACPVTFAKQCFYKTVHAAHNTILYLLVYKTGIFSQIQYTNGIKCIFIY